MSLVGLVVCAYNCQILITRATYLKKASYIMPFGYVSIVFSFMMDIFIFDENFDTISILGMCLTSSGLLIKLLVKE